MYYGCVGCVQIWNHPDILYQFVAQRKEDNDLDLDDAKPVDCYNSGPITVMPKGQQRSQLHRSYMSSCLDEMIGRVDMNKKDSVITYDWVGGLLIVLVCDPNVWLSGFLPARRYASAGVCYSISVCLCVPYSPVDATSTHHLCSSRFRLIHLPC